jgi:hypothetical protein
VNPLFVIFYGILVSTHFNRGGYWRAPSPIVIFKLGLKKFLERCVVQFHVYIWSVTQHHNIYSCLEVWHETQIFINPSRVLNQKFCMQNLHFLSNKPNKPIFLKNFDVLFSMYPYIHTNNTLLIDDMTYKSMFNAPYSAIFWESFDSLRGDDHYVLGTIFLYLEFLHFFEYGVSTSTQSLS